jgi:hypothetical protein
MHEANSRRAAAYAADGDETLPEVTPERRETRPTGRAPIVKELLLEVAQKIDAQPDGKARRALTRKLQSLQFVVDCWGAMPPREEQISAMLEMLLALQEATTDSRSALAK